MKKFVKRITLATLAGVGMLACVGAGAANLTASADTTAPVLAVELEQKASVRTTGEMGIRFKATVENVAEINAYYGDGDVVYGMLIAPADYLTEGKTLAFGGGLTEWTGEGSATGMYKKAEATPNENGEIYGSFIGIQENNYSRPFAARAYIGVRADENAEWTYTYSDVYSRAVYTVASYAVLDGTDYPDEVDAYLGGVVTKVQETYDDLSVDLGATEFDGTNNVVTPNATVSNGTRTLETGVAIESDNMTKIDTTTYEVDTLGDFTATASIGETAITLENLSCNTVVANNVDGDIYPSQVEGVTVTSTATLCNAQGRTNVIKWGGTGTYTASALHFADPVAKNMKAGTYISFDIWTDKTITPSWDASRHFYNTDSSDTENTDRKKFFDEEGWQLNTTGLFDSKLVNQWVTVELHLPDDYVGYLGTEYQGLQMLSDAWESANVYIDNFKVSTVGKTNPTEANILVSEADLTNGNMYTNTTTQVSLSYVAEEIDGKSGVFKWSTASETDVASDTGTMLKFKKTTATQNLMKTGAWLSFDLYVDATEVPRITFGGSANLTYLYTTTPTADGDVRIYDKTGALLTKSMWGLGATNIKQWLHFEIRLPEDFNFDSNYRGLYIYPAMNNGVADTNFNSSSNIYLANVKISAAA